VVGQQVTERVDSDQTIAPNRAVSIMVHRALLWWVDWVAARPGRVALTITLLTLLTLGYTIRNLTIDTSTTEMISPDVPFRQNDMMFRKAFPQFAEPIVAVIQADIPEAAEQAAQALAER
jgi:predicted RND superfamily exporter protein